MISPTLLLSSDLPNLELPRGEVHIWTASLDLPALAVWKLYETLDADEKKKAERFHFEKDRRRFVTAHAILRNLLGLYPGVKPEAVRFRHGEFGKPALSAEFAEANLYFNLSHSQRIALYGFSRGCEIGVDVEYMRDISEMERIVEGFFSIRENEIFRSLPESQKKEAFFNGWTCKEAFIKALGDGLSLPLDKFHVSLVPGESGKLLGIEGDSKEASHWCIRDLQPAHNYAGAFAVKGDIFQTKRWRWDVT
jgi:4'-phosphopantetheinyl transferase